MAPERNSCELVEQCKYLVGTHGEHYSMVGEKGDNTAKKNHIPKFKYVKKGPHDVGVQKYPGKMREEGTKPWR